MSLALTKASAHRLHEWGKAQGIVNIMDPEDFHITVCYSKRPLAYTALERLPPLPVKPIGFDLFGKEKNYLVMKVHSKLAEARHATARALGAAHDFPDYRPHISLAKGGKMPKIKDIVPFDDLLFTNRENVSVLDTKYTPGAEGYVDAVALRKILR